MNAHPKRRWYQFGLRTLLAFMFVLAMASTWYGYRLRLVEQERSRLAGDWLEHVDADPLAIVSIPSYAGDTRVDIHIPYMPFGGLGQIDFQMQNETGVSRGIYRWGGDTITVAQADSNQPRPTSFEKADGVSIWTGVRKVAP